MKRVIMMGSVYSNILQAEKTKKIKTMEELPGFYNFMEYAYDIFLKLHTHKGKYCAWLL